MLIDTKTLQGFSVHARDGEIGTVQDLYFDDESWGVRYFTVETGGWLEGRPVLISPISVIEADREARVLRVALTKQQVESSPAIDTHQPVSRRHEAAYMGHYGYPYYWGGPMMWGSSEYPASLAVAMPAVADSPETVLKQAEDYHLRSVAEVKGYAIAAQDGDLGHAEAFLADDVSWAIRYLEIATTNWWPGRRVLVSPAWIEQINWGRSAVEVHLSRDAIRNAPAYDESLAVTQEYEGLLEAHYGAAPAWLHAPPAVAMRAANAADRPHSVI